MAQEQVAKVYEHVMQDESLQERISKLTTEEVPAAFAEIGREKGIEVSEADVKAAIAGPMQQQQGELGEEQLDAVSGGFCVDDCLPSGTGALKQINTSLEGADLVQPGDTRIFTGKI